MCLQRRGRLLCAEEAKWPQRTGPSEAGAWRGKEEPAPHQPLTGSLDSAAGCREVSQVTSHVVVVTP